jgi:hypothetical protein
VDIRLWAEALLLFRLGRWLEVRFDSVPLEEEVEPESLSFGDCGESAGRELGGGDPAVEGLLREVCGCGDCALSVRPLCDQFPNSLAEVLCHFVASYSSGKVLSTFRLRFYYTPG